MDPSTVSIAHSTQAILSSYATHVLTGVFSVIQEKLLHLSDASAIQSVLTQVMYYGMSLGRMGLDFRHWVSQHFEDALYRLVETTIQDGTDVFVEKFVGCPLGPWKSVNTGLPSTDSEIMAFPLLASLLNSYLNTLNQIRILPVLSNRSLVLTLVQDQLLILCQVIQKLGLENESHWPDGTRVEFEQMCQVLVDLVLPQIRKGFEGVYGCTLAPLSMETVEWISKWASIARRRVS